MANSVDDAVLHSLSDADLEKFSKGDLEGMTKEGLTALAYNTPLDHSFKAHAAGAQAALLQGLTLNYGDELTGGVGAALDKASAALGGRQQPTWADAYNANRDRYNYDLQQFRNRNPWTASILGGVGAAAPAFATAGASMPESAAAAAGPSMSVPRIIGNGATTGATYGAIAGAGDANPGNRLTGANTGALWGGLTGAAIPPALMAASSVGSALTPQLSRAAAGIANRAAPNAMPAAAQAATAAPRAFSPASWGSGRILSALEADGVSPGDLSAALAANPAANTQTLSLADLPALAGSSGDATRRLGRAIYTAGGKAGSEVATSLENRAQGQTDRVVADLNTGMGVPAGGNATATAADLRAARQARSTAAYQGTGGAFDPTNDGVPLSPDVANVLVSNPLYARIHQGEVDAWNSTAPFDKQKAPLFQLDKGGKVALDENGRPVLARAPTTVDVDMIKRANDQQVYQNSVAAKTGQPNWSDAEVRNRADASTEMLKPADVANPAYAAARAQHATDTELMAAHEAGRNFLNDSAQPGMVDQITGKMRPDELDQYRLGVAQAIAAKLGNTMPGGNGFRNTLMTPNRSAALKSLFPTPDAAARFDATLQNELQMSRTRNVVTGGSQTANKASDVANEAIDFAHAAHGSPHAVARVIGGAWQRFTNSEGARQQIATDLFMKQGPQLQDALQVLGEMQRARASQRAGVNQLGAVGSRVGAYNAGTGN